MTEDEFFAAIQPPPPPTILYRLYYDVFGNPLFYSQEDLPGNYIDLDRETYILQPKFARVVDGKLVIAEYANVRRLREAQDGTPCHPLDISIVVESSEPHKKWSMK